MPTMAGDAAEPLSGLAINEALEDFTESSFECCVCLDLLYKPVVLACGHISCFWCVHKAMNSLQSSHCAICRHPYNHFPSICQLLHHLLLKIAPEAYERRENEVLEEERLLDVFSPQFLDGSISKRIHYDKHNSSTLEEIKNPVENLKTTKSIASGGSSSSGNSLEDGICKKVSISDVLCALCKELLFQPSVLNCGHVYCKPCLPGQNGGHLKCHVCQSLHPGELPNVCLDLSHFLEEQFPREYTARRNQVQLAKVNVQEKDSLSSSSQTEERNAESSSKAKEKGHVLFDKNLWNAHYGVGCDSCGVYPIVGKRYRCKDCKELIGFDLCEACYNTDSKLPGRFNQQHTPDHEFELDDSKLLSKVLSFRQFLQNGQEFIDVYVASNDQGGPDDMGDDAWE